MRVAVIADEITAAGWRLAGTEVQTPEAKALGECFRTALSGTDLVLITAEFAARLPVSQLEEALGTPRPLVLVIPDLRHNREAPRIEDDVGRALGVSV
jgi:vacuolar-type H+-ATPase subunit F/Vma7